MALALISGYAVAALNLKWWDHTYVRSNDAYAWGCFGRNSAGQLLDSAMGDSSVADCLAKPIQLPRIYAGISYGLTGVCHQAANRILYPAGITVAAAKGYGLSMVTWGTYGRGAWPQRDQCVQLVSTQVPALPKGDEPDMQSKTLSGKVHAIHQRAFNNPAYADSASVSRAELQALADASLGVQYDQAKIAMIINLQQTLHQEQESLVRQFDGQFLSKKQYLERLNALLHRIYSECEKILGSQDFEKLFGAPLDQVVHMVDPDVFLATR